MNSGYLFYSPGFQGPIAFATCQSKKGKKGLCLCIKFLHFKFLLSNFTIWSSKDLWILDLWFQNSYFYNNLIFATYRSAEDTALVLQTFDFVLRFFAFWVSCTSLFWLLYFNSCSRFICCDEFWQHRANEALWQYCVLVFGIDLAPLCISWKFQFQHMICFPACSILQIYISIVVAISFVVLHNFF